MHREASPVEIKCLTIEGKKKKLRTWSIPVLTGNLIDYSRHIS